MDFEDNDLVKMVEDTVYRTKYIDHVSLLVKFKNYDYKEVGKIIGHLLDNKKIKSQKGICTQLYIGASFWKRLSYACSEWR